MKRKHLVALLILITLFSACRKKKQYSTWIVNGETFSSNDVIVTEEKTHSALWINDLQNRFVLSFSMGNELPKSGEFELKTFQGQQICGIHIYVHGKFYYHTPHSVGKINASAVKGKARYVMPETWFVNYDNPTEDSVLISGEFNEP